MNLSCKSNELENLCIEIQNRTSDIVELENLILNVAFVNEFDDERIEEKIPDNPAAFSREKNQIQIKQSKFSIKSREHKIAILVHEIGEAYKNMHNLQKLRSTVSGELPYDILVDRFVCKWGFFNEIKDERKQSQGNEYAECLKQWENEEKYVQCMSKWWIQKHAGIKSENY